MLVVSQEAAPYERSELYAFLAAVVLGVLVVAGTAVMAWRVTAQALRPVAVMAERAADWSEHDLGHRFALGPPTNELAALGETLDHLLDRVASAIRSEQRLTSELAHELRTPLTAIQGSADLALLRGVDDPDVREDLHQIAVSAREMSAVITTLLDLARDRTTPGRDGCHVADVMPALVAAAAGRVEVLDRTEGSTARIAAPAALVVRAVAPLVDNAVRHARSRVVIEAIDHPDRVELVVATTVTGCAPASRPRSSSRASPAPAAPGSGSASRSGWRGRSVRTCTSTSTTARELRRPLPVRAPEALRTTVRLSAGRMLTQVLSRPVFPRAGLLARGEVRTGRRQVRRSAQQPGDDDAGDRHRQRDAGEHDELELRRDRRTGATEQCADEGAGQRDETGRAGLVEVRQQRLAHGLLPDLEVRAGRRRAERQPRLDLVAAVPDAPQEVATRQRRRAHRVADDDAGDRHEVARLEGDQPQDEHQRQGDARADHHAEDRRPAAVPELAEPSGRGHGRRREHQCEEGDDRPRDGQDPAEQEGDDAELDDRAGQRRQRRPAEADPGSPGEQHRREHDDEQAGAEPGVVEDVVHHAADGSRPGAAYG